MLKDAWDCIYGSKSHLNLAGKIVLGLPLAPFVFTVIFAGIVLDFLFSKKNK